MDTSYLKILQENNCLDKNVFFTIKENRIAVPASISKVLLKRR